MIWECAIIIYLAQGVIFFQSFLNVQNIVEQVLAGKKKPQTYLNWTWHFGCCLRFFLIYSIFFCLFLWRYMLHATCYMLLFLSTYVTEREDKARADSTETEGGKIKHHMMGAVIASQTTERIKNPLPSSRVLLPHPLPLMELLPCLS